MGIRGSNNSRETANYLEEDSGRRERLGARMLQ